METTKAKINNNTETTKRRNDGCPMNTLIRCSIETENRQMKSLIISNFIEIGYLRRNSL